MAWTTLGTVAPGDVLRANSGTAAYNSIIGNVTDLRSYQNLYASYRYTAGDITLTGTTTWSTLTTISTAGDLTLNAAAGDVVEAGIFAFVNNAAVDMAFDVVTVVGSTVTNSFGTAGAAPANFTAFNSSGWFPVSGAFTQITGTLPYTLVAGDVSGGTVKLRVRYACSAATSRTLFASSTRPFVWWARNYGPVTS